MGAGELPVELERPTVVTDRLLVSIRLGVRDRHVLQDARIRGVVPQGEAV